MMTRDASAGMHELGSCGSVVRHQPKVVADGEDRTEGGKDTTMGAALPDRATWYRSDTGRSGTGAIDEAIGNAIGEALAQTVQALGNAIRPDDWAILWDPTGDNAARYAVFRRIADEGAWRTRYPWFATLVGDGDEQRVYAVWQMIFEWDCAIRDALASSATASVIVTDRRVIVTERSGTSRMVSSATSEGLRIKLRVMEGAFGHTNRRDPRQSWHAALRNGSVTFALYCYWRHNGTIHEHAQPMLVMRRIDHTQFQYDHLTTHGVLDQAGVAILRTLMTAGCSLLISGEHITAVQMLIGTMIEEGCRDRSRGPIAVIGAGDNDVWRAWMHPLPALVVDASDLIADRSWMATVHPGMVIAPIMTTGDQAVAVLDAVEAGIPVIAGVQAATPTLAVQRLTRFAARGNGAGRSEWTGRHAAYTIGEAMHGLVHLRYRRSIQQSYVGEVAIFVGPALETSMGHDDATPFLLRIGIAEEHAHGITWRYRVQATESGLIWDGDGIALPPHVVRKLTDLVQPGSQADSARETTLLAESSPPSQPAPFQPVTGAEQSDTAMTGSAPFGRIEPPIIAVPATATSVLPPASLSPVSIAMLPATPSSSSRRDTAPPPPTPLPPPFQMPTMEGSVASAPATLSNVTPMPSTHTEEDNEVALAKQATDTQACEAALIAANMLYRQGRWRKAWQQLEPFDVHTLPEPLARTLITARRKILQMLVSQGTNDTPTHQAYSAALEATYRDETLLTQRGDTVEGNQHAIHSGQAMTPLAPAETQRRSSASPAFPAEHETIPRLHGLPSIPTTRTDGAPPQPLLHPVPGTPSEHHANGSLPSPVLSPAPQTNDGAGERQAEPEAHAIEEDGINWLQHALSYTSRKAARLREQGGR
jgi:hypothetical protein